MKTKTPSRLIAAAILAVALHAGGAAQAGFVGINYYDNQLFSIDQTTGAGTLIGNLSSNMGAFGLAQTGGKLYTFDSTLDRVAQISATTGKTVADINVGIGAVLGQGGMAFRSDGVGFLSTALNPNTLNVANYLYTFNIATGMSTLLNPTTPSGATLAGLAFLGNTLYGLGKLDDTLYTVNQLTGATTAVGTLGAGAGSPFESLSAGPGGSLYATLDDRLFSINPATGSATPVDPNPSNYTGFDSISGLTFVAPAAATVPEPASVALLALGLGSALLVRHRRKPAPR